MGVWVDDFLFYFIFSILVKYLNFVTFLTVLFEICWWAMGLMSFVLIYPCPGQNFHVNFSIIGGESSL